MSEKQLKFSKPALEQVEKIVSRYPEGRQQSALIPVLKLAQEEFGGWLSKDAMNLVAETLSLPYIRVYEVATFYTMFNLQPVGKYHVQVCTNCGCMVSGSAEVVEAVKKSIGLKAGDRHSNDGMFTFDEVECLGACVEAPVMQIGKHYYTKLDASKTSEILENCKKGKQPEGVTPTAKPEDFL